MEEHRSGFVNIIGRPNVGKSTLLNALVGEKMSIITHKPQTTRHRLVAILNEERFQIIFSDTPGIVKNPAYKMHNSMNRFVKGAFEDADIMIYMVTPNEPFDPEIQLLNKLKDLKIPTYLVLNKIDIGTEEEIEKTISVWKEQINFSKIFRISALQKTETQNLLGNIIEELPEGPVYYPKDQITDRPMRFFVTEIIRQHIMTIYKQEIPYSCEVIIEYYQENQPSKKGNITKIGAIIFVNRETQKQILIGKGGSLIKKLGTQSRKDIEAFINTPVFLELHVKVKKDWRDNEQMLNKLGYQ